MSRAFAKEPEDEWLGDVAPDVASLERHLKRENGGARVVELRTRFDDTSKREVHEMSDGNCYALDDDNRWYLVL